MHAVTLIKTEQAAEVLGVKRRTLEGWRCRGEGPPIVRVGGAVRYSPEALAAWIATRTEAPAPTRQEADR